MVIGEHFQRCQKPCHLLGGGPCFQFDGMEGDKQVAQAQFEVQAQFQRRPIEQGQASNVVDAKAADQEDPFRVFAKLDDPSAVVLGGDEMQVGHLGDRMADRLINGALGGLATAQVGEAVTRSSPRRHHEGILVGNGVDRAIQVQAAQQTAADVTVGEGTDEDARRVHDQGDAQGRAVEDLEASRRLASGGSRAFCHIDGSLDAMIVSDAVRECLAPVCCNPCRYGGKN